MDKFVTDCYCYYCGRRFKGEVDFDARPARHFGYYQVVCPKCAKMTPKERDAYIKAECMRLKPKRRK